MNHLYEAIAGLGRAMDSIRHGSWRTASLGGSRGPRCAIGHVSYEITGRPIYLTVFADPPTEELREQRSARNHVMWIMADALRNAVTPQMYQQALAKMFVDFAGKDTREIMARMESGKNGSGDINDIQTLIVRVNDSFSDKSQAADWFSNAIDLLVDELLPAMPRYNDAELAEFDRMRMELDQRRALGFSYNPHGSIEAEIAARTAAGFSYHAPV